MSEKELIYLRLRLKVMFQVAQSSDSSKRSRCHRRNKRRHDMHLYKYHKFDKQHLLLLVPRRQETFYLGQRLRLTLTMIQFCQ